MLPQHVCAAGDWPQVMSDGLSACCRLENATLAVCQSGDLSVLTPDLKGKGTTATFTNAVIKQLEKKFKGRYD